MKVVVIGAGGHARSVCDVFLDEGKHEVIGLLDPGVDQGVLGIPLLGDEDLLEPLLREGRAEGVHVALGSNKLRRRILERAVAMGYRAVSAVSPHAVISRFATLGEGIAVMAGAVVNVSAVIGDGCILNTNCSVDHDSVIGPYSHVAPGAALSGNVRVGEGSFLGTGCRVIDGVTIGAYVMLGAGGTAIRDLPEGVTAVGVPAKVIKKENTLR